jgi:hypothetical protein
MDKESKSTVIMRSTLEDSTKTQDKDLINTTLRMEIDMKDSGYITNTMAGVYKYLQMDLFILGYEKKTKEMDDEFISLEIK